MTKEVNEKQDAPVAYGMRDTMIGSGNRMMYVRLDKGQDGCTVPLYTKPQPRKPLTDKQREEILDEMYNTHGFVGEDVHEMVDYVINAVEAAHGIKENT